MLYSWNRKNVTQLILNQVWKVVYQESKLQFLDFGLLEENFKDKLQDILKELKTCMTNEKGEKKAMLQSD